MKNLYIGVVVLILAVAGYFYFVGSGLREIANYKTDTVIEGDLMVKAGEKITLADSATLTVKGSLDVAGAIVCSGGKLDVVVEGDAFIEGSLFCEGEGESSDSGISIVAKEELLMGKEAEVISGGNIQIVGSEDELLKTDKELSDRFDEIARDEGAGMRVGPLLSDGEVAFENKNEAVFLSLGKAFSKLSNIFSAKEAKAHGGVPIVIGGRMTVTTPPKGIKRLVILAFPDAPGLIIQDFELTGPDGREGEDDKGANCSAKGKKGEDAFRFTAVAPNLTVNNFTLNLGSGGEGGEAETPKNCKPGRAEGGKGGDSGNFKMIGSRSFEITGSFLINPGYGGAGGGATAYGKDGAKSEDGGDATAIGGRGADNKKVLRVAGTVSGVANAQVGDLIAGAGGSTLALPGKGGDGEGCNSKGGKGGNGTATAGAGGDAKLTLGGGAVRAALAKDIGGKGGTAEATGAAGGAGGSCDAKGPGGNGGNGGNAVATEGKGGMGSTGRQSDGSVLDETGGNGGNGGDGCREGKGGKGGTGDPKGGDGKDGKNLCILPPKGETYVDPGREEKIKVIQYGGKYLPVDQLIIEDEIGCGADHWHAAQGVVVATDGSQVYDPGPQCGFGKTKDLPIMEINKPAAKTSGGTIKVCGLPGGEPCPPR